MIVERAKWSRKRARTQPIGCFVTLVVLLAATACGSGEPAGEVSTAGAPAGGASAGDGVGLEGRVLLIGIDGVRPDVLAEVATPNLDRLAAEGWFTVRTRTTEPSVSGPSWSSMLTGVWPDKHGVLSNDFVAPRYDAYPDFLTRIERARPEARTVAIVDWSPLMELDGRSPAIGLEVDERHRLDGYALGWTEADVASVGLAEEELREGDPHALFLYLGDPDETSHEHGSIGVEYRDAIAVADTQVGQVLTALRSRPAFQDENWLVLVSTDHGRRADGGHGGDSSEEMTTFILVSGGSAPGGVVSEEPTAIVDVAVTALAHVGVGLAPSWGLDGRPVGIQP